MYFEVSIPGRHILDSCYTLATTDFDLYSIPLPLLGIKGGTDDDVLLAFKDSAECLTYGQQLQDNSLCVTDDCLKKKYKLISERLSSALEKEKIIEKLDGRTFRVVGAQISWAISAGNTLTVSGPVINKVRYVINTRNGHIYLDLDPKLSSEYLRIQERIDLQLELISEYSGKLEFVLMPQAF